MIEPLRVLVVDDSALMRRFISDILRSDPGIEVVGTARDGLDALEKLTQLQPDVLTLDVEMPNLDGLATLKEIMTHHPVPVVMLSALTTRGAEITLQALELGAIDFVAKPRRADRAAVAVLARELPLKVKAAARADLKRLRRSRGTNNSLQSPVSSCQPGEFPPAAVPTTGRLMPELVPEVLAIGTSTGGPAALTQILPQLPATFPLGIVVAQHMPPGFTRYLAERLDSLCQLRVKEAQEGELVEPGLVLIAPAGYQLTVRDGPAGKAVVISPGGDQLYRPSVDLLFRSVAQVYGNRVLALILTGMGEDGRRGLEEIKARGGYVLAEARETCVVYGMPRAAIKAGVVDEVLPLYQLAPRILQLVSGQR